MKKKILIVIFIMIFFIVTLVGCDEGKEAIYVSSDNIQPEMTCLGRSFGKHYFYFYVIDNKTKIVYIQV